MKAFTQIPFFRILFPFITGILVGVEITSFHFNPWWFLILLVPLLLFNFYVDAKVINKRLFMLCADLILIFYGIVFVQQKDMQSHADYYANLAPIDTVFTFIASVNELPVKKEKFTKCELKVLEVKSPRGFKPASGTLIGYFKNEAIALKARQTLLIKTKLTELDPPKNPFEFDYKSYLNNKQIYHTAFIDSFSYSILEVRDRLNPLWRFGLGCKQFILNRLKNSALDNTAYGICAALLTGYDDEIDKTVIEAFLHSGTLHVLSVSGLHTGLIYLALNFILNFFDKKKKYKLVRLIVITVSLWFFALITGFSAPVLRAVIMFNLLGVGRVYFRARQQHQLNILLVSAFILLIYNPFLITDVGFLLSYFAMFGLLHYQPKLARLWEPENKILDSVWQSVTASFAATISTLPITLFYFKQFPLWFFVCNIVVIPATFLILLLSVFVIFKINVIAIGINYLIRFLIFFIDLFNSENFGFVDTIHFNFPDVLFLSFFIITVSLGLQYRAYRHLAISFMVLIIWQVFSLFDSYSAKTESLLTVYNVKKKVALSVKNKTSVTLNEIDPSAFNFHVKPHINSFNYPGLKEGSFNTILANNEMILLLNRPGSWPKADYSRTTILVLSNNFVLCNEDLKMFKNLKTVVLDASNNNYRAAKTEELSRNFGLSFYNTKLKGAYLHAL